MIFNISGSFFFAPGYNHLLAHIKSFHGSNHNRDRIVLFDVQVDGSIMITDDRQDLIQWDHFFTYGSNTAIPSLVARTSTSMISAPARKPFCTPSMELSGVFMHPLWAVMNGIINQDIPILQDLIRVALGILV
jgi:hypothetical protein